MHREMEIVTMIIKAYILTLLLPLQATLARTIPEYPRLKSIEASYGISTLSSSTLSLTPPPPPPPLPCNLFLSLKTDNERASSRLPPPPARISSGPTHQILARILPYNCLPSSLCNNFIAAYSNPTYGLSLPVTIQFQINRANCRFCTPGIPWNKCMTSSDDDCRGRKARSPPPPPKPAPIPHPKPISPRLSFQKSSPNPPSLASA